jgi:hypothetical protein
MLQIKISIESEKGIFTEKARTAPVKPLKIYGKMDEK